MKLWDKGVSIDKIIENFTVGEDRQLDLKLAQWDILGSLAHIQMLESIDLLTKEELKTIQKELIAIYNTVVPGGHFIIEDTVEDVHSQIEYQLTKSIGETGKKIHSGRSRNDQVLVDLKLYFRHEIELISLLLKKLFYKLSEKSEELKNVLMPGYTHMQVAMPSSFGMLFGAYSECLVDDIIQLKASFDICNQNPLGSAAGYGSSFPLNRSLTTELLGFESLAYNSIYAQLGRGRTEKSLAVSLASIASTLGKIASDICLFNGQDFNFFKLPTEYTTGSSIMPHKKNPDVFEILRGKSNKIQSLPNSITMGLVNLQTGYHRDMQLLKEELFPAIEDTKNCIEVLSYAIEKIEVNKSLLKNKKYDLLFTVEEVNRKVYDGIPFRDAYKQVGLDVESGVFKANRNISHSHEGSIGNLCNKEIQQKFEGVYNSFPFKKIDQKLSSLLKID